MLKSILSNKIWDLQEEYAEIFAYIRPHSLIFFSIIGYSLGIHKLTKFIASLVLYKKHTSCFPKFYEIDSNLEESNGRLFNTKIVKNICIIKTNPNILLYFHLTINPF